jgi:hypothetical protein
MVERSLSMREVPGSIPGASIYFFSHAHKLEFAGLQKMKSVESLQSHMSHWSSGLPVCFPSQGTQVQNPWGGTYVKPGFSCYIATLLHW